MDKEELRIQTAIKFRCVKDGWQVNSVTDPRVAIRLGLKGLPDIFGYTDLGYKCLIEVKIPKFKHKVTPDQQRWLKALDKTKFGFASATKSLENYKTLIECPDCHRVCYGDICFYCNIIKI